MRAQSRVIVVGAGLVGSALAAELLRRGHAVVLLERAVPGAEASSAAGGILSPQAECDAPGAFFELCRAGLERTRAWARTIRDETGIDVELDEGGTDIVTSQSHAGESGGARAQLAARVAWQRAAGLRATLTDDAHGTARAHFPDEARLDPRAFTRGMLALAKVRGAEIKSGVAVARIAHGAAVSGVEMQDGARIDGDAVVVCAGAWTSLVPDVGVSADDVFPVRGQMLELAGAPALLDRVVFTWTDAGHAYVIPRRDGRLVCGSTMEHVGFDKRTTDDGLARVLAAVHAGVPETRGLPVTAAWAGLRPGTRDGLPRMGAVANGPRGLFVSTGHFRNGVLLAAVCAERVAADIAAATS